MAATDVRVNKCSLFTGLEAAGSDQGGSDRLDERVSDMVVTVLMEHTKGEKFNLRLLNARPVWASSNVGRDESNELGGTVVIDLSDDGATVRVVEGLMEERARQALLH